MKDFLFNVEISNNARKLLVQSFFSREHLFEHLKKSMHSNSEIILLITIIVNRDYRIQLF